MRFVRDEWRARLLRLSFEQHLAPEVVRRIAADPTALRLRGEMREITALFTDIEGFTSMTERAEPTDLVALLDAYFDVATRIVTDHGGMIDKIVGDAIHAIYNAPFELEDHAGRAVASALALLEASEEVRKSPLGQRLRLGRTRVGIETGPAIVGDVGGSRKLDYTAHGNAMNAAARLEAANKDLGSSICIGPGTAAQLEAEHAAPDRHADPARPERRDQGIYACIARCQLTDAIALAMRAAPHWAGGVGSAPMCKRLVPCPATSSTALFTPTTVTAPRATKTPNMSLLGPAKKRVPRTAISPNGPRTATSLRPLLASWSNSMPPRSSTSTPPAFTRKRSMRSNAPAPSLTWVAVPKCIASADCAPVPTASPTNTAAAGARARRSAAVCA